MHDEEIALLNACTNLVTSRKAEAFPSNLFQTKGPGDWVSISDLCARIGIPSGDLTPKVFATWLPDPMSNEDYAVILFYDDESKWSLAAHYNRARLLKLHAPTQSLQPTESAIPSSTGRTAHTMPAAEL